jgi:hypothetical protein
LRREPLKILLLVVLPPGLDRENPEYENKNEYDKKAEVLS